MHYVILLNRIDSTISAQEIVHPLSSSSDLVVLAEIIEGQSNTEQQLTNSPLVYDDIDLTSTSLEEKPKEVLRKMLELLEEDQEERQTKFRALKNHARTEQLSEEDTKFLKELERERELLLQLLRNKFQTESLSKLETHLFEQFESERERQLHILRSKDLTKNLSELDAFLLKNIESERKTQLYILRNKARANQLSESEAFLLSQFEKEREMQLYILRSKIHTKDLSSREFHLLEELENEQQFLLDHLKKQEQLSDSESLLLKQLEHEESTHIYTQLYLQREKLRNLPSFVVQEAKKNLLSEIERLEKRHGSIETPDQKISDTLKNLHEEKDHLDFQGKKITKEDWDFLKQVQNKVNQLNILLTTKLKLGKWQLSPEQIIGLSYQRSISQPSSDKKSILELKLLAEQVLLINNAQKEKERLKQGTYWFAANKIAKIEEALTAFKEKPLDSEILKAELERALAIRRYAFLDKLFKSKNSKTTSYLNAVQLSKLINQDPPYHRQIKNTLSSISGYFSGKSKELRKALDTLETSRDYKKIEQENENVHNALKTSFFTKYNEKNNHEYKKTPPPPGDITSSPDRKTKN